AVGSPCSMADRMRVTSLMASARAAEKVGCCRFYKPPVAVAIKRQGGERTRVAQPAVDDRSGGPVGGAVGCARRSAQPMSQTSNAQPAPDRHADAACGGRCDLRRGRQPGAATQPSRELGPATPAGLEFVETPPRQGKRGNQTLRGRPRYTNARRDPQRLIL